MQSASILISLRLRVRGVIASVTRDEKCARGSLACLARCNGQTRREACALHARLERSVGKVFVTLCGYVTRVCVPFSTGSGKLECVDCARFEYQVILIEY